MEDMFKYSPSAILRDDVLESFVGEGCISTKGGIGHVLGVKLGQDDVSLTGFAVEYLSHIRYHKVKKVFYVSIWWKSGRIVRDFLVDFVRFRVISS